MAISSTFYEQLLRTQIPKAQKDTDELTVFFMLSGSARTKTACKTLMKSTPRVFVPTDGIVINVYLRCDSKRMRKTLVATQH